MTTTPRPLQQPDQTAIVICCTNDQMKRWIDTSRSEGFDNVTNWITSVLDTKSLWLK